MTTSWVITTAAERLVLDDAHRGTTTLTVTNISSRPDRAILEIVTDPAAQSWFTVEDPQRSVPATASVQYVVKATVPPTAAAGQYQLQGRVYSADSAPEETSVLSNRILVDVAGTAAPPPPRFRKWWPVIPAALVVIAITAVVVIVVNRDRVTSPPTAAASNVSTVVVPSVIGLPEDQAVTTLDQAGLTPVVRHRHANPAPTTQSIPANTVVARGTTVELDYSTILTAPVLTSPGNGAFLPRIAPDLVAGQFGTLAYPLQAVWTQKEPFVTSWQVVIRLHVCSTYQPAGGGPFSPAPPAVQSDRFFVSVSTVVTSPSYQTMRYLQPQRGNVGACGEEVLEVAPLDDFGRPGLFSLAVFYRFS